jgi:hypothetical protein
MQVGMPLGEARQREDQIAKVHGPGPVACFDWRGCAARLEVADFALPAQIERFLGLPARSEEQVPPNSGDSVVSVLSKDRGLLVRTSSWQAWAAGRDQLLYLVLEALGQVFVDAYAGAVFHAGAIDLGNGALVIHGPAQSGKSTLAYAAWRRGFTVLSDDRVTLGPELDSVQPFPKCLKLRCHGDDDVAMLVRGVPAESVIKAAVGNERRVIFARSLPGFADFETARPIRALIQLDRVSSDTTLEPIEPSAALGVALRSIVSPDFNPTAVVRLIKLQADQQRLFRLAIGDGEAEAALERLTKL